MIVITAATAIGSYTAPNYMIGFSWRIFGYALTLTAITRGVYGMTLGTAFILMYLSHIKSFGIPYLSPLTTSYALDVIRDSIFRMPVYFFKTHVLSYNSQKSSKHDQVTDQNSKQPEENLL
jgi:hypothetical protein